MYRIRRLSGGEVNLASLDELAAAIAAGTVTADAEIYHQRGERWLPIASHPHFRIAKDRSESPVRNPTPAPAATAPAPAAPPTLRLVRSDMNAAAPTSDPRPASRWSPPQRPMNPVPRPSGSAAPAAEPAHQVVEFVAEQPPAPPVPAEPPARPKRVEPAVAGLPLLDVEMPEPPRTMRQPAPLPSPSKSHLPLALPEPGPTPIGARLPTPMPSPAAPPTMQSSVRTSPRLERTPLPAPVAAPAPTASMVTEVVREPVAAVAAPAIAQAPLPVPLPWQPQAEQDPLDVPPPVQDFSVTSEEPVVEAPEPEPVSADAIETPAPSRTRQRWPMIAGAVVVMAVVAFLALRPRSEVDSLDPNPIAARPASSQSPSGATQATLSATPSGERPQVTPVVPPGPSLDPTAGAETESKDVVVPAAPRLRGAVPESALRSVGSIKVDMDPTAASAQKGLEETRRQIEEQMQR